MNKFSKKMISFSTLLISINLGTEPLLIGKIILTKKKKKVKRWKLSTKKIKRKIKMPKIKLKKIKQTNNLNRF